MHAIEYITTTVTCCSVAHTLLPPFEAFNAKFPDNPRLQLAYKVFIYILGYVALNARSTVYPVISTDNGTKTSKAANGNGKGNGNGAAH